MENYTKLWSEIEVSKLLHLVLHGYSNDQIASEFLFMFPNRTSGGVQGKVSDIRRIARPETTGTTRVQMNKVNAKRTKSAIIASLKQPIPSDLDVVDVTDLTPKFHKVTVEEVLANLQPVRKPQAIVTQEYEPSNETVKALPTNQSKVTAQTMLGLILNNVTETIEINISSPSIKLNLIVQAD